MRSLFKHTILTIWVSILTITSMALISHQAQAQDLLETVFKPAKQHDYVINVGTTRDSVGKAFFRNWYTISIGKWRISWSSSDPIVIRIIKRLLEIVVILWVPMLIYWGIRYIMAAWDEWAQKTSRTLMINVVIGIILALSSLAIVTLVSSILNDSRLWQDFAIFYNTFLLHT